MDHSSRVLVSLIGLDRARVYPRMACDITRVKRRQNFDCMCMLSMLMPCIARNPRGIDSDSLLFPGRPYRLSCIVVAFEPESTDEEDPTIERAYVGYESRKGVRHMIREQKGKREKGSRYFSDATEQSFIEALKVGTPVSREQVGVISRWAGSDTNSPCLLIHSDVQAECTLTGGKPTPPAHMHVSLLVEQS